MNETKVLPIDWPITIVKGDKQRPIVFTLKDANGDDLTGFTYQMTVKRQRDIIHTYEGGGNGAELRLDLTNDFQAGVFRHVLRIILSDGSKLTPIAGDFWNTEPGEETGGSAGKWEYEMQLPVIPQPVEGGGIGYAVIGSSFIIQ